ncbi:MAG: site-specific DNA-methyltransferase [Bacteroidaceae bacterium]|jgi:site-specific DNA-methyltransferase (adenine-specific)|nr:site-specific DNA-methyltransferase [Bacteroidaceae bacterium]
MPAKNNRTLHIDEGEHEGLLQMVDGKSLIQGDTLHVLPTLPDGFANLIIVDPPYNLARNFGGNKFTSVSAQQYEDYLRSWFYPLCDKLAPSGSLYMCGDWRCSSSMQRVIEERLTILNRITWQREKGRGAAHNWKNSMEDIWFAVKNPNDYYFDLDAVKQRRRVLAPYRQKGQPKDWEETEEGRFRTTCPSNFWDDITVPFWSMPENTDHPTQKPEKLIAKLILASSKEGDLVFDPFLGSGTTAVVAKKLGRRYCGIELNLDYLLLTAKRLLLADQDSTIQGYTNGIFWERNSGK